MYKRARDLKQMKDIDHVAFVTVKIFRMFHGTDFKRYQQSTGVKSDNSKKKSKNESFPSDRIPGDSFV